ncbi:FAD-dependent oxidoreductase [Neorhizobium sp. NCHU2750]|uniref:NAD(P)/FAD-dependent oxidoreductase n=1 Tax=Neorhizobium sp. NCHU2750 TaxID=1825976 RepID=UPI000E745F72|nr:D-amino acid dehydrogenase [Neorhizobium sp. NCHU2750]
MSDCIVLGAGMIGVSVAIHLAERGRSVVLMDRRGVGEETSFGNAGLLQREGVSPHGFPQDLPTILRHALNRSIDSHYHLGALPAIGPFLARYWWNSRPARYRHIQRAYGSLIERSVDEHAELIRKSGASALIRKDGWISGYRSAHAFDIAAASADRMKSEFGVEHAKLSRGEFSKAEPSFLQPMAGAIRWTPTWSTTSPNALIRSYADYFKSIGGQICIGDASTLAETKTGWRANCADGVIDAKDVIIALGPWGRKLASSLGYRLPLAVKRGYHMHYQAQSERPLNNWFFDAEIGYMVAPMDRGIRLTTGAEFARHDAPPTPVQLDRAEPFARQVIPMGERIDVKPWMGARPVTPDMLPIVGPAPRHKGLWFALGHSHHGLTLGPVSGRLLAEQITGQPTAIDPSPYLPTRFKI